MNPDGLDDLYPLDHPNRSANFEVERVSVQIDAHYAVSAVSEVQTQAPRPGSRIVAMSNQLSRSQANLESTSARFNELASAIPSDIADLSDRLSGILNGALAEADDIRAEARRFADEARHAAEQQAAVLLTEARVERQSAVELRAELEAQHKQLRVHAAQLRQQAVLSAAEIMKDAESQALEILSQMNQNINTQVAEAQLRLNDLMDARGKIIDQIRRSTAQAIESPGVATDSPDRETAPN